MSQVIGLSTFKDQHIYVSDRARSTGIDDRVRGIGTTGSTASIGGGGCDSGSQELVSLSGEYNNHLSSIVSNNYNLLFGLSPPTFEFPVLLYYIYQLCYLYSSICEICKICNSKCKCECTCKCEPPCKGNFICLCLCDCTNTKPECKECCICICKHKSCNCKCICICPCKKGDGCCCESGQTHECKQCVVKVDIKPLLCDTWRILCDLRWIKCCISRLETKCCLCSCCQKGPCDRSCCSECSRDSSAGCCCCSCSVGGCNRGTCESYCCCKTGGINYLSIITRIHSIEFLFKKVGTKIAELRTLKNKLTFYSKSGTKCEPCESCGCKEKVQGLIKNIESVLKYYSSFASVVGDIRMLVDYKTFCPQSNEIIEKLKFSVKPLLNQLYLVNQQLLDDSTYTGNLNKLLVCVYSHYCIFQCFLALYILLQSSSKLSIALYIIQGVEHCQCVRDFDKKNGFKTKDFNKYLIMGSNRMNELKKLVGKNDGNHFCLCLATKYVMYPFLIKSMYCIRQLYYESLSKLTKEFIPKMFTGVEINDATKLLYLMIIFLDKIKLLMKNIHIQYKIYCLCKNYDESYYPYLISIILFVSSLIENIWTMDSLSVRLSIEKLSSLLSEYQSIHVYTNYGSGKSTSNVSGTNASKCNNRTWAMTLTKFISTLSATTITSNSNGNGNLSMVVGSQLTKSQTILVDKSVKAFFKSLLSSLSILIETPLFSLVYSNISNVSFYLIQNGKIIGLSSKHLRTVIKSISVTYLECTNKEQCDKTCCQKSGGCKMCIVVKINYLKLGITMKMVKYVLASVITDLISNKWLTLYEMITDMNRITINNTELILRRTKNNLITHPRIYSNDMGLKDPRSSNWGYDIKYEHSLTILSN